MTILRLRYYYNNMCGSGYIIIYYTDRRVCIRIFPRITAATDCCIVRQPVVLDFYCEFVCVRRRLAFIVYSVGLYFFLRYLLLFFRLVLSSGQLKSVLNEPMRIPQNNILLLLLLPVYYCNYGGSGKRGSCCVPVRYYFYLNHLYYILYKNIS